MEEVNLKDMFNYFISKFTFIASITVIIGILGIIYTLFIQVPMYNSYTTLVLTRVNEDAQEITANDITINSKLVSTYSKIIKSNRIISPVIKDLNLDMTEEELKEIVTVTNEENTELIKISVNTDDPSLSCDIVNKIAERFSEEIVEIYQIQNITIIDKAEIAEKPYNINILKQIIIYLAIGIGLSMVIVFVMYYFDNKIKSVEEVEEKIGLPILGTVPNRSLNGRKSSKGVLGK